MPGGAFNPQCLLGGTQYMKWLLGLNPVLCGMSPMSCSIPWIIPNVWLFGEPQDPPSQWKELLHHGTLSVRAPPFPIFEAPRTWYTILNNFLWVQGTCKVHGILPEKNCIVLTTSTKVWPQNLMWKKLPWHFFLITTPCFAPLVLFVKKTVWNPSKIWRIDVKYLKKMSLTLKWKWSCTKVHWVTIF